MKFTKETIAAIAIVAIVLAAPGIAYVVTQHYDELGPAIDIELTNWNESRREVQANESVTYEFSVESPATDLVNANIAISKMNGISAGDVKSVTYTMDGKSYAVKIANSDYYVLYDYAHIGDLKAGKHTGQIEVTYSTAGSYSVWSTLPNIG